ncbi:Hypothetical protein AA314_02710 [Archangium gephyra]|uniref:Uncharacterized protein n=1 Tax=Archangium gephyra TaxID=48 RepID=A0AAC8Q4S1_9BACT|nr:Hypothetical protein AA314_02710 [Archangium gephyra]
MRRGHCSAPVRPRRPRGPRHYQCYQCHCPPILVSPHLYRLHVKSLRRGPTWRFREWAFWSIPATARTR